MDNIQEIYDSLWEKSMEKFRDNKFELDYYLTHRKEDHRRGITLIARLENKVITEFIDFMRDCKLIEPDQHYYDSNDIHITVLSIITCFNGFAIENLDRKAYADIIKQTIKNTGPLQISFRGITASPSCIMIQGFPTDNKLNLLREHLRESFQNSALDHSIDKRYPIKTAHSTIVRFKDPITDNSCLIDLLNKYRNYNFGVSKIEAIDLVYNDWYMTNKIVSKINTFPL